jgi:hypothetical protein
MKGTFCCLDNNMSICPHLALIQPSVREKKHKKEEEKEGGK